MSLACKIGQTAHMGQPILSMAAWILILAAGLCASPAHAWGSRGHRITGHVAESLLTEQARREVQDLLSGEGLDTAALFMDSERKTLQERWPESSRWHYDNRPACGKAGYCADDQCATRQIDRFSKVLSDRNAPKAERTLALKLLVHMVGDIHQPLHMADNSDRGGNDLQVRVGDATYRLHELFDTVLVKQISGDESTRRYAKRLLRRYEARVEDWQHGGLNNWADETYALAVRETYRTLPHFACNTHEPAAVELPVTYLQRARDYLPEQLAKAGVRIAAVLNQAL